MRLSGASVIEVDADVALPIARAYCREWRIEHDPEAGERMFWLGAVVRGMVVAVLGFGSLGEDGVLVTGVFTTGGAHERTGVRMLLRRLEDIPWRVFATLHLATRTDPTNRRIRQFDRPARPRRRAL